MKKILTLIMVVAIIMSGMSFTAFSSDEVIFSDSFESNFFDFWTYSSGTIKSNVVESPGIYSDNQKSLFIVDDSETKTSGVISKQIKINAGETYTAAFDVYAYSENSIRGFLKFLDDNKQTLFSKSFRASSPSAWAVAYLTQVAPENAKYVTLTICGTAKETGKAFVDNARIYKGEVIPEAPSGVFSETLIPETGVLNIPAPFRNIFKENHGKVIFEESFENGMNGWTPTKSSIEQYIEIVDRNATDGKFSLHITDPDGTQAPGLKSPFFDITPGETYTLYGNLFIPESVSVRYYFKFFDENSKQIVNVSMANNINSNEVVAIVQTAPENAVKAQVWVVGTSTAIGDSYADSIKVCIGDILREIKSVDAAIPAQTQPVDAKIIAPSGDKLKYNTYNEQGDKLSDFSYAGFYEGEYELPDSSNLETAAILEPAGPDSDDTERIQKAIDDTASTITDGNMKVIRLKAGRYNINQSGIRLRSGIILSGEGQGPDGTVIYGYSPSSYTIINLTGVAPNQIGEKAYITDSYVKAGSDKINISADAISNFNVGDLITIYHPSTEKWGKALGMNPIINVYDDYTNWTDGNVDMHMERRIKSINGTEITLDFPMFIQLDTTLSGCYIYKTDDSQKIRNAGIENLRVDSYFDKTLKDTKGRYTDEAHASCGVNFQSAVDCFAKDVTVLHTGYNAFKCGAYAKRITIRNCSSLEPVSTITGSRRYSFACSTSAQQILVTGCYSSEGRHDFETSYAVTGPIVYHDDVVDSSYAGTETHGTWSTGVLYDNVYSIRNQNGGDIYLSNHGTLGTKISQGWTTAGSVVWNSMAPAIVVHKPYLTYQNFAVGAWGIYNDKESLYRKETVISAVLKRYRTTDIETGRPEFAATKDGTPLIGDGYKESEFTPVNPGSLFKAQLSERYTGSYKNVKPNAPIITSPGYDALTSNPTVTITGIYKLGAEKVTVYIDDIPYNTVLDTTNNTFSITATLENGIHKIYATQWVGGIQGSKNADRFIIINDYNGNASYLSSNYTRELTDLIINDNRVTYDAFINNSIKVYVNSEFLKSDVAPFELNGRVLVPMRAIFEKMNAEVSWDEATATATATDGTTTVKITENSSTAYVNGNPITLDVPAIISNGRFVVPVRFISESFGAQVEWVDTLKAVKITK